MNAVLVFPSPFSPPEALMQAIRKIGGEKLKAGFEGGCIVCEQADPVELASRLASLFGVDRVAVARKVPSRFADVSRAIVDIGSKVVLRDETFYVKVIQAGQPGYVSRDVEFASAGALAARLAGINALPAKSEQQADRVILALTGKESAYVCIQVFEAPGGLPSCFLGRISCVLHGPLSLLSCFAAAKAGFMPDVVLLYADENELLENAKLAEILARKTGAYTLSIAHVGIPNSSREVSKLAREQIALQVLIGRPNSRMALPLSSAIHPLWFIESAMRQAQSVRKTLYMPLMFLPDDIDAFARQAGLKGEISCDPIKATEGEFQRHRKAIDSEARASLERMKMLRLKVGPNYLHDILDSA